MTNPDRGSRKGRGKNDTSHRDTVGAWVDLTFEKIHDHGGTRYSSYDLLLRQVYKEALEGKPAAVKAIVRMLRANIEERAKQKEWEERHAPVDHRPRRDVLANASLALLILGIGALDNAALKRLGQPGDAGYERRLRTLQPNRIEQWAVDAALAQPDQPPRSEASYRYTVGSVVADSANLTDWETRKAELLAGLMRLRGPGATRFVPGQSGNRLGRPPKCEEETFPYDDFFMEPLTTTVDGRERTITRLDALMHRLTSMAMKDNKPLRRLITPVLMKFHELRWQEDQVPCGVIVRG